MAAIAALDKETELSLVSRAQRNDAAALQIILTQYEPSVSRFASAMHIPGYDREDNRQEVRLAIIDAVRNFDPDRDVKLITYVFRIIIYSHKNLNKNLNRDKRRIIFTPMASLDEPYQQSGSRKSGEVSGTLTEILAGDDESGFDEVVALTDMLAPLNTTEREVALLLYSGLKVPEIAPMVQRTSERVTQIKSNIATKLLRQQKLENFQ